MKKIRIGSVASLVASAVVVVGGIACSAPDAERSVAVEQRLDSLDDASTFAPVACDHPLCATGAKLTPACDPCAALLCASDPYCCSDAWDATCVSEVASICGQSCTAPPPADDAGESTCAHGVCVAGPALATGCSPCATQLCAQDPYCCAVEWDATCVGEVASICGQGCN
jgi:hypothetical protein